MQMGMPQLLNARLEPFWPQLAAVCLCLQLPHFDPAGHLNECQKLSTVPAACWRA
jgi:hypothetical protein